MPLPVNTAPPATLLISPSINGELLDARILLVDDVMENIQTAGQILRTKGYHLNIARSGPQALEVVRKSPPDLILLDIFMPGMDGFECCQILKSDPTTRDIPLIFLTANTETDGIVRGFEVGAVDYVFKPFNAPELLSRIHTHLSLRSAQLRYEALTRQVSRYVSPHVYSAIIKGEKTASLDTVEKPLTIFFSDIVGFTRLTESLGDQEITLYLNEYLRTMGRIVHTYGGTLDKFIGDAVMVFFGDPESRGVEKDAAAAVCMALEMNEAARQMDIRVRMALHSGPALVGNFGTEQQMNYTIIGKAVNIASRLESASEPGRILISETTRELLGDAFVCQPRSAAEMRDVEGSLRTYWVTGSRNQSSDG